MSAGEPGHGGILVAQLPDVIPPASWTVVMGSGVVSIDLAADRQAVLSAILLWFAAAAWLLLVIVLGVPLVYQRDRFAREARSPASLTAAAGTAVLGTRLVMQDYRVAAAALLAVAAIAWALFLTPVLRHWETPTTGISFVVGVAAGGLAVLSAALAVAYRAGWLVSVAVLFLLLGLGCYVFTVARFGLGQLLSGQGDQWVAGGALAICALAAGQATAAASALGWFRHQHQVLTTGTLVLWCLAMVWLFPLVSCEILRPRLRYDVRRWATVFPVGMYAACSFAVGQVTGDAGITGFARVWTWVAFTVTVVVLAGLSRRARHLWRRPGGPGRPGTGPGAGARLNIAGR